MTIHLQHPSRLNSGFTNLFSDWFFSILCILCSTGIDNS
jgi:hypothetical protein